MKLVSPYIFVFVIGFVVYYTKAAIIKRQVQNNVEYDIDVEKKSYKFSYDIQYGSSRQEEGHLETDPVTGEESLVVKGEYTFLLTDAQGSRVYVVKYTADKNGYRPTLEIIPVSLGGVSAGGFAGGYPGVGAPATEKAIDATLLCSLGGSGCK